MTIVLPILYRINGWISYFFFHVSITVVQKSLTIGGGTKQINLLFSMGFS